MQAKGIIELMNQSVAPDEETLNDLQSLVEEYPYFQTARILYALNLRATKDSRFNAELRKATCYASDRKKLFYLVEEKFHQQFATEIPEKKAEPVHSSFDLINFFLAGKDEEKKKPENRTAQFVSTDYLSYALSEEETGKQETETAPLQHQETIDKFLEEDEKTPIKIVFKGKDAPIENAPPGLDMEEESNFFTETLAKIYLKQKKYVKALEIIRKLNLLYPEKNIYFADQIRFLEKLIINEKNKI
ncbi:MAG: tetratricopeptide repeat protein [Candidatus Symbiothrix sp.]|jgi:hypothetical protein|nr:tetratricopeptide repeat protein [Candidatus Symbiothrix sp.]